MSHGLQIYDSGGNVIFDSNQIGWRWIDQFYVGATESGTKSYPGITGTIFAMAIPVLIGGGGHKVTVSFNSISWEWFSGGGDIFVYPTSPSNIIVYAKY